MIVEITASILVSVTLLLGTILTGLGFMDKIQCVYAAEAGALAEATTSGTGQNVCEMNGPICTVSVANGIVTVTANEAPELPLVGVTNLQGVAYAQVRN